MNILDIFKEYKEIVMTILTAIGTWIFWSIKQRFVPSESLEKVTKEMSALTKRLDQVESEIKSLPKAELLHTITLEITKVRGALDVIAAKFDHTEEVADRMQLQVDRMDQFMKEISLPKYRSK